MKRSEKTPISDLFQYIGRQLQIKADRKINEFGLNAQQGRLINYIYRKQSEGVIQKDLAEMFDRKSASITSMLQGLEKKGYIKRCVNPQNEREKNIYVLEKGMELVQSFDRIFEEIEAELVANLTEEEQTAFKKILNKINSSL